MTEPDSQSPQQEPQAQVSTTGDGSPTLLDLTEHAKGSGEAMHNSRGALSESLYVYGPALELAFRDALSKEQTGEPAAVRVLVVGMGLGYLELMTLARSLGSRAEASQIPRKAEDKLSIISYESNPLHRERILKWLENGRDPLMNRVAAGLLAHGRSPRDSEEPLPTDELRAWGHDLHSKGLWDIRGTLDRNESRRLKGITAILFDPYSPLSCPALWEAVFLDSLLEAAPSEDFCVLASYASRGPLHRALTDQGFRRIKRRGFGGKRECTLALRGESAPEADICAIFAGFEGQAPASPRQKADNRAVFTDC